MEDEKPLLEIDTVKWMEEQIAKGKNPLEAQKEAGEIALKQEFERQKQEAAGDNIIKQLSLSLLLSGLSGLQRNGW